MNGNRPYPLYDTANEVSDLKDMVKSRAERLRDMPAFYYREGKGVILTKTFGEVESDVNALGAYFLSQGLTGVKVGIVGENSYEYISAFLALANGANVAVPIDKELSSEEISERIRIAECAAVIVSEAYADCLGASAGVRVFSAADFGRFIAEGRFEADKFANSEIDREKCAAIFFTSGTTGKSKGVMLSHKSIAANINSACKSFVLEGNTLAVLPFHHAFGLIIAAFGAFNYGRATFINSSIKTIAKDFKIAAPQTMCLVPIYAEAFCKQIRKEAEKDGKEARLNAAIRLSDTLLKIKIDLRRVLFKSIIDMFGGNLKYIICGGAPLEKRCVKLFRSIGTELLNGYGITECSPVVSVNGNNYHKDGSVGQVVKNCEVKISEDGEVLVKGENVMLGYYGDEDGTKEAMRGGWYHTGDLGYVDKDGFLFLTGRKKNLIILSNGENVSPEELEERILSCGAVREVVCYEHCGAITAEIFPTEEHMGDEDFFKKAVKAINRSQPSFKRITGVRLRDEEFPKNTNKKILRNEVGGEKDERGNN